MEKSQYNLCLEVLRRLNRCGLLEEVILIGSWCIQFYKDYFANISYMPVIKTRDMDFLIAAPNAIKTNVDLPELLKELGFIVGFSGEKGYIRLEHPQLLIEFLVPQRGTDSDRPIELPQLNMNATALRFLDLLASNVIKVKIENFFIKVPHPANFAIQKLIVSQRRRKAEKSEKDLSSAIMILKALIIKNESGTIKSVFNSVSGRWQRKIVNFLKEKSEIEILNILKTD